VSEEGNQEKAGTLVAGGVNRGGFEANCPTGFVKASALKLIQNSSEQGLAAQVEKGFILAVTEILEAGAYARSGNESFHPLLRKAFRSLGQRFRPSDRRDITVRLPLKKRPIPECSTWNSSSGSSQIARRIASPQKHHCRG